MKPIGFVYLTTNLVNGKVYVGKHEFNAVKDYIGSGTAFKNAVKKYGKENFRRKILRLCYSLHELRIWEHVYIIKYKRMFGDDCYNIAKGDVNTTEFNPAKLPEVRKKIKDKIKKRGGLKGKNNPMYGKHWSKRKREQMTFMFNNNHPMLGRKHSEETKKHWSSIRKGKYAFANLSEEQRYKIYDHIRGKNNPMYGTRFLWINNGVKNKRHNIGEEIPNGWKKGYIRNVKNIG